MKKLLSILVLLSMSSHGLAAFFSHTDSINRIGAIESREDGDYIVLNGLVSAGSCPLSGGLVVARFRSEGYSVNSTFSIALAAKMANKKVTLAVDDTKKNSNGFCFVHSVTIAD